MEMYHVCACLIVVGAGELEDPFGGGVVVGLVRPRVQRHATAAPPQQKEK